MSGKRTTNPNDKIIQFVFAKNLVKRSLEFGRRIVDHFSCGWRLKVKDINSFVFNHFDRFRLLLPFPSMLTTRKQSDVPNDWKTHMQEILVVFQISVK